MPSQFVRRMYLDAGLEQDRVHVVPNGVDLERFAPDGARPTRWTAPAWVRFLFVGGAIARKGVDILLAAWEEAFAGRDDVQLVIKDFGSDGVYRGADRSAIHAAAQAGSIVHLDADLADAEMAALYRACDVPVHPYRGEGFAMPVLEAMASGLPVIHTAGGPTDEFCPPQAGWRIRAQRRAMPGGRVPTSRRSASRGCSSPIPRTWQSSCARPPATAPTRGCRGASAARPPCTSAGSASPALYDERTRRTGRARPAQPPRERPRARRRPVGPRHSRRGAAADELPALLRAWTQAPARRPASTSWPTPRPTATPAELEARVMAAAAGIDLDACADITILREHAVPGRDAALHAAADSTCRCTRPARATSGWPAKVSSRRPTSAPGWPPDPLRGRHDAAPARLGRVTAYNLARFLGRAIDSALARTGPRTRWRSSSSTTGPPTRRRRSSPPTASASA